MIFRNTWEDHREELFWDFKHFLNCDPSEVISGKMSVMTAAYYIISLMKNPASRVYAAEAGVIAQSREEKALERATNAVINGWDAKKSTKEKAWIKEQKAKIKKKKSAIEKTTKDLEQIFSRVKIEGKENISPVTGRPFED